MLEALRRIWLLATVGAALSAVVAADAARAQGACRDGYQTPRCPLSAAVATAPIKPVFPPTGWRTTGLDTLTIAVADVESEAAFYVALMGWRLESLSSAKAVLDLEGWGSVTLRGEPGLRSATVRGIGFVISPWSGPAVERALRARGLAPVRDDDGRGFESFHVKDPDGLDLQIANRRRAGAGGSAGPPGAALPPPFAPTGWRTVWLDHLSLRVSDYKRSASFYENLLGWTPTYDEGSQAELMIGAVGDIILRGGNPMAPGGPPRERPAVLDHISFGIAPWDTDGVRSALEARGLPVRVDTSTKDEIHVAAYKSYHTRTPNGFDLQISFVSKANRLALSDAVRPR